MSIEGQGHFFTIYFSQVLYVLCFTRSRYQVSAYRTIGPLVYLILFILAGNEDMQKKVWMSLKFGQIRPLDSIATDSDII